MKQFLAFLFTFPTTMYGQYMLPDTVDVVELDAITVVADNQRISPDKTVYTPTHLQKTTASGGITLLARMSIPQLSVNPVNESVTTSDGRSVTLFINYSKATAEDIAGLNPDDVRTVEYLCFPTDPRFMRAEHVINFVTGDYHFGGYTKLSAKERFMINSGELTAYSKFARNNMEYDAMVTADYDYNPHTGSISDEKYKFAEGTIERESRPDDGRRHQRGVYAAVRASWNKSRELTLKNMVSYRSLHTPLNETSGTVSFSDVNPVEKYFSQSPSCNSAVAWNWNLYTSWKNSWAMNCDLSAELLGNTTSDLYHTDLTDLHNHADERAWDTHVNMQINKSLSDKLSLFTTLSSAYERSLIKYTGTSNATNHFNQFFAGLYLGISLNYDKISGSIDGGYAMESNSINGQRSDDTYPFTHLNVQFAPDRKNVLGLWFQYATISPGASMKNPNLIRQSELMYVAGNPDLGRSRLVASNLSYTWLPNNQWQLSAYVTLFRITNRQIAVYLPDAPDGMMLKKYFNDGDYNHGQVGTRVTGRFFDGKLTVSLAPRWLLYRTTGSNAVSYFPFSIGSNADYYMGNFFINAFFETASGYVDGETAYLRKMPGSFSIGGGWASRGWNVQLSLANPFRSSWIISNDRLRTRWYDCSLTQLGNDTHRRLTLGITYTINYGKKSVSTSELDNSGSIPSSILR